MEKVLLEKVEEAIEAGEFQWDKNKNHQETHLVIRDDGVWGTKYQNEYGSTYGYIRYGRLQLTATEQEFISNELGCHVSIPLGDLFYLK
jgi:hypothetical protein